MTNHITPAQARELLKDTTPGPWEERYGAVVAPGQEPNVYKSGDHDIFVAEGNYVSGYADNEADAKLTALAPTMARMIAGARQQWAIEVSMTGLVNPNWDTAEGDSYTSHPWVDDRSDLDSLLERMKAAGIEQAAYRVITRLIIDLEEEL